jgi:cation diffusion facilitator CzcD-associated flavoprotein CzcO
MPDINGLERFKGVLAHTANYPEGLDLKGKKVAVCGIGSSGIQVIAAVQKDVSKLYTWIRSPTWVLGSFGAKYVRNPETDPNPACKSRSYPGILVSLLLTHLSTKIPKKNSDSCEKILKRT